MIGGVIEAVLEIFMAFFCIGMFWWLKKSDMAILKKIPITQKKREQLEFLNPLEREEQREKKYWEEKIKLPLFLAGISFLIAGLLTVNSLCAEEEKLSYLIRGEAGEGSRNYNFYVMNEQEKETWQMNVRVEERKPSEEEAQERFSEIYEYIQKNIVGENGTLDEVRTSLSLMETIKELGCTIQWTSDDLQIIDTFGNVKNETLEEPCMVYLTAEVGYGGYEKMYYFSAMVYPEEKGEQSWIENVEKQIQKVELDSREEKYVTLPDEVEEKQISYQNEVKQGGYSAVLLGLLAATALFWQKDCVLPEKQKKREAELMRDYASVVSKLTLLLGAGMTLRMAWERIVEDGMKHKRKSALHEEMQVTYYELKQGVAEGMAYKNFGRRIGLKPYRKLGNLLEQNLRRGNTGLSKLLEAEVTESFELRKSRALIAGEEASSKLLIPMFLMLLVVLVICIAPALLSF